MIAVAARSVKETTKMDFIDLLIGDGLYSIVKRLRNLKSVAAEVAPTI